LIGIEARVTRFKDTAAIPKACEDTMTKTILVADESRTIQTAIELTLRHTPFQTQAVFGSQDALRQAAASGPDLILLSAHFHDADGYQICAALRGNPATAHTPVVLLTSAFHPIDPQRAAQVGLTAHIDKPFDTRALIELTSSLTGEAADASLPMSFRDHLASVAPPTPLRPVVSSAPPPPPPPPADLSLPPDAYAAPPPPPPAEPAPVAFSDASALPPPPPDDEGPVSFDATIASPASAGMFEALQRAQADAQAFESADVMPLETADVIDDVEPLDDVEVEDVPMEAVGYGVDSDDLGAADPAAVADFGGPATQAYASDDLSSDAMFAPAEPYTSADIEVDDVEVDDDPGLYAPPPSAPPSVDDLMGDGTWASPPQFAAPAAEQPVHFDEDAVEMDDVDVDEDEDEEMVAAPRLDPPPSPEAMAAAQARDVDVWSLADPADAPPDDEGWQPHAIDGGDEAWAVADDAPGWAPGAEDDGAWDPVAAAADEAEALESVDLAGLPELEPPPPPVEEGYPTEIQASADIDATERPLGHPAWSESADWDDAVHAVADHATGPIADVVEPAAPGVGRDEILAMAREIIERVAWEVVPDLAETIIRAELARLLGDRDSATPESRRPELPS
jgi:CheY-like chemotaxis protein